MSCSKPTAVSMTENGECGHCNGAAVTTLTPPDIVYATSYRNERQTPRRRVKCASCRRQPGRACSPDRLSAAHGSRDCSCGPAGGRGGRATCESCRGPRSMTAPSSPCVASKLWGKSRTHTASAVVDQAESLVVAQCTKRRARPTRDCTENSPGSRAPSSPSSRPSVGELCGREFACAN